MNELLPSDQRYYQFMGSLTTPPCTEGVLWMVLKQPVRISAAQFKLFSQLFPLNARPVQPVNGRPVREAK
jgi:carbonic anhydrase